MRQIVLLAMSVPAFSLAAQAKLARPAVDTLPHGVVRVRNTGPSQWLGTTGWRLAFERSISADGDKAVLAEPRTLAVDSHGNVFETDWKVEGIQEFDPTGKFVRQIGRKGNGPGEFQVPIDIAIRGDTLLAYASNESRVSLWKTDGTLLKEWHVDFCCGSSPRFGDRGSIMVTVQVRTDGKNRGGAIRWRPDGTMIDTLLLPFQAPSHIWETAKGGAFPIPFSPYQVGTFNPGGTAYISGFGGAYTLVFGRRGADTTRIVTLPGVRAAIPSHVVDSVFDRYARIPQLAGIPKRGDMPGAQPFFRDIQTDESGNIWIPRTGPLGRPANYDVLNRDGVLLGSVALPAVELDAVVFANGRLFGITQNADGEYSIQVYRIDKGAH